VSAAQPGVHQEVGNLYHEHHRWLQGWLRHKLGNAFDAADVAHDTFMRLLNRDEAIAAREPRAFLTTVAKGVLSTLYYRRDPALHLLMHQSGQACLVTATATM